MLQISWGKKGLFFNIVVIEYVKATLSSSWTAYVSIVTANTLKKEDICQFKKA